jgi:hypothetical protein
MLTCSRDVARLALLGLLLLGARASAQTTAPVAAGTSRAQLQARLILADSLGRKEEAERLRTRLATGDFAVGDRIVVSYEGLGLQRGDTLVVQAGRVLRLGQPMGDMSVYGVLRSDIGDSISSRVSRYFKNEVVHVTPLLRISISGAVRSPGVQYTRADVPISDLVTRAGGDQSADLHNVVVKRGEQLLWGKDDLEPMIRQNTTLDGLGIEPGDEVIVGARSTNRWPQIAQFGLPILSAIILQMMLRH